MKGCGYLFILAIASIVGPTLGLFGFVGGVGIMASSWALVVGIFWAIPVALAIVVIDKLCEAVLKNPSNMQYAATFVGISLMASLLATYQLGGPNLLSEYTFVGVALFASTIWCLGRATLNNLALPDAE